jgi:hypothetical protein
VPLDSNLCVLQCRRPHDQRGHAKAFNVEESNGILMARRYKRVAKQLKLMRQSRNLTMRDVHRISQEVAAKYRKNAFLIPPSRLSDIENQGAVPSIFRLHTLSVAYAVHLTDLLSLYGIERDH